MRKLTLNEIQAVELENLKIIDRICQEQGLTYYLAYGTLLGAVRHQDFIPWDDDTDIWMPRRDYEAFIAYCEHALPTPYRIVNRENTPGYPYGLARFSNQDYEFVSTKPSEQFPAASSPTSTPWTKTVLPIRLPVSSTTAASWSTWPTMPTRPIGPRTA